VRRYAVLLSAAAGAVSLGCQTKEPGASQGRRNDPGQRRVVVTGGQPQRGGSIEDIFGPASSSEGRLHELSGPLLAYYGAARRLPDSLEELQPMAGTGQKLEFTSPISGKRLVYTPSAVPPPGQDRRLVLYDPTPTTGRTYWAILMGYPRGDQPAATWVVELPQQALRSFASAATTQPAAADVP
jgi:hypothetical protein